MNAVMLSIRPEWCEKILNGKKTVEVRKTFPHDHMPFKCYIYCTKKGSYGNNALWKAATYIYSDERSHNAFDERLSGTVVGEFVCDRFDYTYTISLSQREEACMGLDEIENYAPAKNVYLWHISNLKIYEIPKKITDFYKSCRYREDDDGFICTGYRKIDCPKQRADRNQDGSLNCLICTGGFKLSKPPQSWCYVEELEVVD